MKKVLKNQKGQGIMEYIIISSLVGICCLVAMREFGQKVKKRITDMQSQIVNEINFAPNRR